MSKEMINLVIAMNQKELAAQLALQCAPVLMGFKISNLLIVEKEKCSQVMQEFTGTELSSELLMSSDTKAAFLIYRKEGLCSYLEKPKVWALMKSFGYDRMVLEEILEEFSVRYTGYVQENEDFPHEMGLLLGYPAEDVAGFIQNEGENFLYSGYWKVYANLSEALDNFSRYKQAKETAVKMVLEGKNISYILNTRSFQNSRWKQITI